MFLTLPDSTALISLFLMLSYVSIATNVICGWKLCTLFLSPYPINIYLNFKFNSKGLVILLVVVHKYSISVML